MTDWREHYRENDEDRDRRERDLRDRRIEEERHFGGPRVAGRYGGARSGRPDPAPGADAQDGAAARGYGDGGQGAYGQMARGSSDASGGGYGGANVGGWGQSGLTSQWGAGGYGPLNTGLEYGQGGGRYGPQGYDEGDFGRTRSRHHDEHAVSYRGWRDAQLANHDRDYGRWRDEQVRRYDEDYHAWRNERHSAFSREFEGWRARRGGQAAPDASVLHGANPTLGKIAEGHEGHSRQKPEPRRDPQSHDTSEGGPDPASNAFKS